MNFTRSHFTAADNRKAGYTHVLLITTGSVASIKAPLIVAELLKVRICTATKYIRTEVFFLNRQQYPVLVEVIATKASLEFYDIEKVKQAGARVWMDTDEWRVSSVLCRHI